MTEVERTMTMENPVETNNKLRSEIEKLKAELEEAIFAAEHNRQLAEKNQEENQLKYELRYKDGIIYGMKYALRCNGVSGGEVDR